MYYDEESGTGGFMAGLLIGALVGAALALLTVPERGLETRSRVIRAVDPGRLRLGRKGAEEEEAVRSRRRRARG